MWEDAPSNNASAIHSKVLALAQKGSQNAEYSGLIATISVAFIGVRMCSVLGAAVESCWA